MPCNATLVMSLVYFPFHTAYVPPQSGEAKYDVEISKSKFEFGGNAIHFGTTTKKDLEKFLGKDFRNEIVIEVDTELAVWDDKGVRAFYRKSTGVLVCLDFTYTAHAEKSPFPRKVFVGVFNMEGKGLTESTAKADIKAPSSKAISDMPYSKGRDFEVVYDQYLVQVFMNNGGKTINFVKVLRNTE